MPAFDCEALRFQQWRDAINAIAEALRRGRPGALFSDAVRYQVGRIKQREQLGSRLAQAVRIFGAYHLGDRNGNGISLESTLRNLLPIVADGFLKPARFP